MQASEPREEEACPLLCLWHPARVLCLPPPFSPSSHQSPVRRRYGSRHSCEIWGKGRRAWHGPAGTAPRHARPLPGLRSVQSRCAESWQKGTVWLSMLNISGRLCADGPRRSSGALSAGRPASLGAGQLGLTRPLVGPPFRCLLEYNEVELPTVLPPH